MSFRMQRSILQAKLFKATIGMKSSHFLIGWKPLWNTQERLPRSFMPRPWEQSMCSSLFYQTVGPWRAKSWSLPALPLQSKTREFLLPLFERILKTRQAGTRMISKPFGVSIGLKTLTAKPWEIWWACHQAPVEVLKIIPVIWQKWRVQASLSLWSAGMQRFHAWSKSSAARRRTILYWWEKQGSEKLPLH